MYEDTSRELVWRYKFARAKAAAEIIAEHMHALLPHFSDDTIVCYVPTATKRVRQRGYDHAELIARCLAAKRGLACRRLVTRLTQTRQVGSSRAKRIAQMRDAFCLTQKPSNLPRRVLLVDDVLTTGATLESVASVLRAGGVRHVDAAVFAQKV